MIEASPKRLVVVEEERWEAVMAAHFHLTDLKETLELVNINSLKKTEIIKEVAMWVGQVQLTESLIKYSLTKPKDEE